MRNELLGIAQVSDLLGISVTTTRRLIKHGALPAIRVGRQIRVNGRRLREWLDAGGGGITKQQSGSTKV